MAAEEEVVSVKAALKRTDGAGAFVTYFPSGFEPDGTHEGIAPAGQCPAYYGHKPMKQAI